MLELAVDEARRLNDSTIDTQHLLLGLLRLDQDKVFEVLRYLHIDPGIVRLRINQQIERGEGDLPSQN
jgi:ATP-dependent Clp protease ATP-binding subunit ClpC